MGAAFDVPTAYLLLGLIAVASSAGGYLTLRASLHRGNLLWLVSCASFGLGCLLLALRPRIPPVMSFEVAHATLIAGLAGQALAMRQEGRPRLRQGHWTLALAVALPLASVGVFAFLRRIEPVWGVAYFSLCVGAGAMAIVFGAFRLWRAGAQRGAAVIAASYAFLVVAMAGRLWSLQHPVGDEPAFEPGLNQFFLLAAAFLSLVMGQVGYLGMQFERIAKGRVITARQAAVMTERARQTQLREAALHELVEERNQLIQHLARHESASDLARFAMDLPHQLSQPLCASKLNLEEVLVRMADAATDPEVTEALRAVDASNDRVLQLLQQLRILLANHDASDHREVELGALIAQTVPILQGSFRDQGLALEVEVAPPAGGAWVHASPTQMQQLLLILCTNALTLLQAAPREPGAPAWVRVGLAVRGDEAHLTVEDSGPGRPWGGRPSERTNVGLAIATRIAQAHCGTLSALEGERPGATAFRLTLPRSAPTQ